MFPPSLTRSIQLFKLRRGKLRLRLRDRMQLYKLRRGKPRPSLMRSNSVVQASAGQAARERVAWSVTSAVDAGSIRRCFATAARSARIGITTCVSAVTAPR